MLNAKEIIAAAVKALSDKKGQELKVLYTADQTTLAEAVEEALSKAGEEPHHIEGHRGGLWTLLDYSAVVVHIFTEEGREFYDLERLWSDAAPVDISEYYSCSELQE